MKKRSKFISILMCIAMLVTLLVSNYKVGQAAKKKMSINKTKVTMDYDETYVISVKNPIQKVKWTSSNKKIATIKAFNFKNSKCKIFAHKKGKATITVKVGNKKFKCKVTIVNREIDINSVSTAIPTVESQEKYNRNFDQIVAYVIKERELSTYGSYCTYGYVSVSMSGDKIEIFQNWGRKGHNVILTRGSKIATAMATLNNGTQVTAELDISTFKGDGTDRLQWSNNPSTDLQYTYDVAIANILKNVANYNFYIDKYSF